MNDSPAIERDLRNHDYEFAAQCIQPGIKGVRTKGQYQRLLKRRGLTDDVSNKELTNWSALERKQQQHMDHGIKQFVQSLAPAMREADRRWVAQHGRAR